MITVKSLNDCDFCGGKAEHCCSEGYPHLSLRFVRCARCGISTKNFQVGSEAAACWNQWNLNHEKEPQ